MAMPVSIVSAWHFQQNQGLCTSDTTLPLATVIFISAFVLRSQKDGFFLFSTID
jgi:hypothetical protein